MAKIIHSHDAKELLKVFIGGSIGFSLFFLTSHPRSLVHKKLPSKKIRNVHILPHVKIERKDTTYHVHHWINISSLYFLLYLKKRRLLKSKLFHGFLLGSIVQGLLYKDRFRIVHSTIRGEK